jgi:hypothetical protein
MTRAFIGKTEKPPSAEITKLSVPVLKFGSSWWIGWPVNKRRSRGVEVHAKMRLVPSPEIQKANHRAPLSLRRIFPRGLYPR